MQTRHRTKRTDKGDQSNKNNDSNACKDKFFACAILLNRDNDLAWRPSPVLWASRTSYLLHPRPRVTHGCLNSFSSATNPSYGSCSIDCMICFRKEKKNDSGMPEYLLAILVKAMVPQSDTLHQTLGLFQLPLPSKDGVNELAAAVFAHRRSGTLLS